MKGILYFLTPILPYGVTESWDDLNPMLYHAVHIYWLKFYGMWYNSFSMTNILFYIQLLYTLIILWLVCFLPGIGEVVYLLRQTENIGDIAEGLYLFLSEMYTYFKIAVFWLNKDKIIGLLQYLHCEEFKPQEPEHRDIVTKSIKRARFIMSWYSTVCVGAVSVGIIMPMTENFAVLPTNVEYPYFDVYKSPAYEVIYFHHIYYKPATCIIDGAMDTLLAAFVASAIGQIEILAFNLRNFNTVAERRRKRAITANKCDGNAPQDYYVRTVLRDCIIHHNSIIRYVSMIESAFSLASALQFMLSVMVLCLVGIQFLSSIRYLVINSPAFHEGGTQIEEPSSHPMQILWMAIYLTCMLIEVFILCWYGDELITESMDLNNAAFEGPWLTLDTKTRVILIIFLERCKRPMAVTAGKIFTLSLDTYTILINWSYKAFAVMRNMKK